ncbi:sensor histidine kinase [Paenibacillus sp. GXUN7292]|uniref:sensor histidine kinase n=1 Tax=Paenibacillus sp. GXUN7292 TaxID=3422499 RepID=UPI003D7DFDDA
MRLKSKIHLYTSILFAVLIILMNISIYLLFNHFSLKSEIGQVETNAASIAQGIQSSSSSIPLTDLLRAYVPVDGKLQIVSQSNTRYPPITSPSQSKLSKREAVYYSQKKTQIVKFEHESYVLASIPVIWRNGEVVNIQITESLRETMSNLQSLRFVLVAVTLIALIPVVMSGRLLGKLIMQPIRTLTTTMRDIQKSGEFKQLPLDRSSKDELVEMGETFNRMIELLQSNFANQESFVANASHELRTPLTVIESYASLLKRKGLERQDLFQESIEAIHSEAIRMREMTEQLLLLARNKEQWLINKEQLDAAELASASASAFQSAYHRDVHVEGEAPLFVHSDRQLLKQLLFIFLDNAYKYSKEPITITLGIANHAMKSDKTAKTSPSAKKAWIRITDRGVGIPKTELSKVFERFYRVDKARSRQNGGLGLGLSLAREISEAIGARIEMDSLENVGTTVTIMLNQE